LKLNDIYKLIFGDELQKFKSVPALVCLFK